MVYHTARLPRNRTMTAICFVCNLPILSHQVGLVWQGGNGWDDLVREQVEESTLKARLGGRRDSSAQITTISPPTEIQETSPPLRRRRRSSLAQLTDIFKDWGGSTVGRRRKEQLSRRETLADLAKTLPWARSNTTTEGKKRRESSVDSGVKSISARSKQDSQYSSARVDIYRLIASRRQSMAMVMYNEFRRSSGESTSGRKESVSAHTSRRESVESGRSSRRDSVTVGSPKHHRHHHHHHARHNRRRRDSKNDFSTLYRDERRPSLTIDNIPPMINTSAHTPRTDSSTQAFPPPTIITSNVTPTPPSSSPSISPPCHTPPTAEAHKDASPPRLTSSPPRRTSSPLRRPVSPQPQPSSPVTTTPSPLPSSITSPTLPRTTSRRDSTTQVYAKRKDSRFSSPERRPSRDVSTSKLSRLRRQSTAIDETGFIPGTPGRRGSQPTLSAEPEGTARKTRRDSLSPDSAIGRRDSRTHLSPERTGSERDTSPVGRSMRRGKLRRQSTSYITNNFLDRRSSQQARSPDSCSSCSSREASPSRSAAPTPPQAGRPPAIRRQSTTEEILIARGFRRQSTTEEMIRCRNFRRQSSQSEDCFRYRGRRDSCAQITDGTIATMFVETGNTFFESGTQTDPTPLYDNNHYHEECLKCNSCGLNLTGPNHKRARRFKNQILCDLHFADVALMECSDFMQQLRSFKPQSLGCAVARRKSSTTLIFPLPPQACSDEFCEDYPHNLIPTPGYWIECSRQKINNETLWDESDSDDDDDADDAGEGTSRRMYRRDDSLLLEDDEYFDEEDVPPRKKTTIEDQWEKNAGFELTSVEQETYEKYFYGTEHWNYFTNDEDLGPVILSLKQESINNRDQFRILVRAISYTVHGLIPTSCVFADRYNREEVVRSLGKEVNLNPPLVLGQLPDTPEELLKLDQVFIKSELKVGVIYVKEGQYTEEEILDNNENSFLFTEFLSILGDTVILKGFEKYRGGLDAVHDLTGEYSVYTNWRNIEIMFHVSTFLPYEKHDVQKLQRKRHIGNDIVCVVFLEADNTSFSPSCIKSHFLHTFIVVRTSPRIRRKTTRYEVSVVTRDEVGAYKPYLWEQSVFENGPMFREWILTKIVNGERASYSAPKFARMQERTRSQMLEDLVANLQNHAETGQIPKPYRRGSWRPIGHMRPSSPLLDSVRDRFEDFDQLAKDFTGRFLNKDPDVNVNFQFFDVCFLVGQGRQKTRFFGVRAILGVRSRVFQEMLYGISAGFGSPQVPVAEILARAVPTLPSPQKPKSSNFLQVPDVEGTRAKSVPSSPMVKRAFSRLGTITAGWGRSIRGKPQASLQIDDKKKWASSHDCSNKETREKGMTDAMTLAIPRLSVCADAQKIDKNKLAQIEFSVIEFDGDTFRILLDYLHTSTVPITCANVPGLICAAEHYDLPELLQACFHHTKQHLRLDVICLMLNSLENYVWRYNSAVELVNLIFLYIEQNANKVFEHADFLTLSESMVNQIMNRDLDVTEIKKFDAILKWAKNKSKSKADHKQEFKHIMDRLKKDINLMKIAPQDLIKTVLPSKTIENQAILDTLTKQANSGVYRIKDGIMQDFQAGVLRQQTRLSDWDSFDVDLDTSH